MPVIPVLLQRCQKDQEFKTILGSSMGYMRPMIIMMMTMMMISISLLWLPVSGGTLLFHILPSLRTL